METLIFKVFQISAIYFWRETETAVLFIAGIDLDNENEQTQMTITVVTTAEGETKVSKYSVW